MTTPPARRRLLTISSCASISAADAAQHATRIFVEWQRANAGATIHGPASLTHYRDEKRCQKADGHRETQHTYTLLATYEWSDPLADRDEAAQQRLATIARDDWTESDWQASSGINVRQALRDPDYIRAVLTEDEDAIDDAEFKSYR